MICSLTNGSKCPVAGPATPCRFILGEDDGRFVVVRESLAGDTARDAGESKDHGGAYASKTSLPRSSWLP